MTQPDPNVREPLRTVGIATAVGAALMVGTAFGLPITDDQRNTILAAIGPTAAVVVWVVGRLRVFSPAKVHELLTSKEVKQP